MLSIDTDRVWRARLAERLIHDGPILDICTGTGDLAIAMHQRRSCQVIGVDFCIPMLALAKRKCKRYKGKITLLCADSLRLPFRDNTFLVCTVAFGIRNIPDIKASLKEMVRVLKKGGTALILEFAIPQGYILSRVYRPYLRHILPAIGRFISGEHDAYSYLARSIIDFYTPDEFVSLMLGVGFKDVQIEEYSGSIAILYIGKI